VSRVSWCAVSQPYPAPNAIAAIEKLVYYALVVAIVAIALQTVNIPMSAFAVLGGAFAIGLGFGAQNLSTTS
jgi:small-conductance mechanosensitive channel